MLDDTGLDIKLNSKNYRRAKIVVKKLYNLKLIRLTSKKNYKNLRDKKFYSLTDLGLFYLFRSTNFLRINIQTIIKNYSHFKMFDDLLYPYIQLETLCLPDFPSSLLNQISLYMKEQYLKIENFICHTENKQDWNEEVWIWDHEKLRKYLFDKYKYKWLQNAEVEESFDRMTLKFFNNNKSRKNYIEIRFRGDKTSGYLIIRPKNKKEEIYANIKQFLIKFHFTKEESIGRAFSTLDTTMSSKFVFSLLSAFPSFNYETLVLFSKDEKFTKSLEIAKKNFYDIYLSIKNPRKYSKEARLAKAFMDSFY